MNYPFLASVFSFEIFVFANICLLSHYFPVGKKMSQIVPDAIDLFNFWYLCAFAILHICVLSYIYNNLYIFCMVAELSHPTINGFVSNCNVPTFIGFLVIQSFSYFLLLCCANCCYLYRTSWFGRVRLHISLIYLTLSMCIFAILCIFV